MRARFLHSSCKAAAPAAAAMPLCCVAMLPSRLYKAQQQQRMLPPVSLARRAQQHQKSRRLDNYPIFRGVQLQPHHVLRRHVQVDHPCERHGRSLTTTIPLMTMCIILNSSRHSLCIHP